MQNAEIAAKRGTEAVRKLREQKLKQGVSFMINAEELPSNQCYLEYPDGSIKLVVIPHATRDINVIRVLSMDEANSLRARFNFYL